MIVLHKGFIYFSIKANGYYMARFNALYIVLAQVKKKYPQKQ
tara:strand:- start:283 stop:408 length:126 start_codon:yes stop_codon:yes gene_type:complete